MAWLGGAQRCHGEQLANMVVARLLPPLHYSLHRRVLDTVPVMRAVKQVRTWHTSEPPSGAVRVGHAASPSAHPRLAP